MYTVFAVATEILKQGEKRGIQMTPMQLVKLAYIAHGFHLAIFGGKLFQEQIQAWKYGPVIPDLYHATKRFGRKEIAIDNLLSYPGLANPAIEGFLGDVVAKYGHLSGPTLSSITHQSGSPWDQVYREGSANIEIPNHLIKEHYQRIMDDYRESHSRV